MTNRRSFISGFLATGLIPKSTWADVGDPSFLSAGLKPDGRYVLCGLDADGEVKFEIQLPARGHAAAAHPTSPVAVAFARRPGTFAMVLDCVTGRVQTQIKAPAGRHFYGHGTFSADGALLLTTENDFENARGIVGVWDVRNNYRRVGEFYSGGVGPHDIKLLPDGDTLVVANGGIETHPDTGRTKLNLGTMRSNLSFLRIDGTVETQLELSAEHQRNSIRHLAVSEDGDVAFAMQWQGDITEDLALLGIYRTDSGEAIFFEDASIARMYGYLGSVAFQSDGNLIATTSPRSGVLQVFGSEGLVQETLFDDVCGVAANHGGFISTTGKGFVCLSNAGCVRHEVAWDNHLVSL